MATFIKKYNIPYVFVNTENKTPDDVVKEIEGKVNFRGRDGREDIE